MARSTFGGTASDFAFSGYSSDGRRYVIAAPSASLTFWSAVTGGTQYTDLLLESAPVSSVTTDAIGQIPLFEGPDGVSEMWADGGGQRVLIISLTGILAEAAAFGSTNDGVIAGRINDDASLTYAALADQAIARPTGITTTIYASASGNDANDGLTVGNPKTLQGAFDLLMQEKGLLLDTWVVQLAAGTYSVDGITLDGVKSVNRIQIKGPSVSYGTPTAILDGGSTSGNVFGMVLSGVFAYVADIKFQNYSPGTAIGTGFQAQDFSDVWLDNVHADNCSFVGVYVLSNSKLRLTGGTFENCQRGVRVYGNVSYSVGYQSSSNRVTIQDCDYGFEARDMSAGRLDYTDIDSCDIGAWVYQGSRFHPVETSFTNCSIAGVLASGGAFWYDDPNANLVYSGNTINISTGAATSETAWSQCPSEVVMDTTRGAVATHTGTTAATTIVTLRSLPVKLMNEAGSQLTFKVAGVFSGTGDKTVTLRVNGTSIGAFTSSTNSIKPFHFTAQMTAVTGGTQIVLWNGMENGGTAPFVFKYSTSIPFSPSLVPAIIVQGTLTNSAGTIEISNAQYSYLPTSHDWI